MIVSLASLCLAFIFFFSSIGNVFAAYDDCNLRKGDPGCTTVTPISANSSKHFVDIGIKNESPNDTIEVRVIDTKKSTTVYKKAYGPGTKTISSRITGLYSTYRLDLTCLGSECNAFGKIDNY